MTEGLFSVVIAHYNQPKYINTALKSVLEQDYESIELVIADDASTKIDLDAIKAFIEEHKRENLVNVVYSINEKNLGTVKSLNRAVKKSSGEFILCFAADDALANASVVSNFKAGFDAAEEDVYMISAQCAMMDLDLEEKFEDYIKPWFGTEFNPMSAMEQYKVFCNRCVLGFGGTAMKREMFDRFGFFNENYTYVEDWSYYLHLTRNGGRIRYIGFDALLHRDGGISHHAPGHFPPHVVEYRYDITKIFEAEVLPYLNQFDFAFVCQILGCYEEERGVYYYSGGKKKTMSGRKLSAMFPRYYIRKRLQPYTSTWRGTVKALEATKLLLILLIGCAVGTAVMPGVLGQIFYAAEQVFGVCALFTMGCAAMIVLLRLAMAMRRGAMKILGGVKRK